MQDAHRFPARKVSFPTYTPPEMTDLILFPPCAAEILPGLENEPGRRTLCGGPVHFAFIFRSAAC
ncbi:hypothetical protein SDC9_152089 [bioreactor metagenome]|uniref:Uncharacterized protein n=1 Tax=bioreactor metagenome TaxID=1076179 RepID=A0A645ES50_9ZZZZ